MPETDQEWMELALRQAERSVGLCSPNPAVGCVLVVVAAVAWRLAAAA